MQAAKPALRATADLPSSSTSKPAPFRSGWTGWPAALRHRPRSLLGVGVGHAGQLLLGHRVSSLVGDP
jgi:hypothetical protein